jgi:hypothetical protein
MQNFEAARAGRSEPAADGAARPAETSDAAMRIRTVGWALPRPVTELQGG